MIVQSPLKPNYNVQRATPPIEKSKAQKPAFGSKINYSHSFPFRSKEGIQKGIPVFEGLSLKEIFFISRNFSEIALERGCRNLCSHCYISAEPPKILDPKTEINKMSFEDFKSLTDGVKELHSRLNKNIFKKEQDHLSAHGILPFLDGDPITARLTDKEGKTHDIADLTQMAYESFETPIVIDTAGWHKNDKKTEESAKKLAEYFAQNRHALNMKRVYVSINPFHSILEKSYSNEKINPKAAKELREIYTDRMANTLATFLECGVTPFIRVSNNAQRSFHNQIKINQEIWDKTNSKAQTRSLSDEEKANLAKLKNSFQIFETESPDKIAPYGRGAKFFKPETAYKYRCETFNEVYEKIREEGNFYDAFWVKQKTVDSNGKIYLGDSRFKLDTGLQLNFENKDKKTPVIHNIFENNPKLYTPKPIDPNSLWQKLMNF